MKVLNNSNTYTDTEILNLQVNQQMYDDISINRKSTFVNIFDESGEFVVSVNSLDCKGGSDILFLSEVMRAAEIAGLIPVNSLVSYKGLNFRLSAIQTSELSSGLKRNNAKREDFKKNPVPQQQNAPQQAIQNNNGQRSF